MYYQLGKNQYKNRIPAWFKSKLDDFPGGPKNFAEISLTGSKRVLITREPAQIKAMLTSKFWDFGHGPEWHKLSGPFLGNGIFATDGQQWQHSRSIIRPMFIKDRLRNLNIFDACTEKLISKLPPPGETVNIQDLLPRWTLDITTDFLLGKNVNSLDK